MIFNREPVRLLLNAPDQRKHSLIARNTDLMAVRGHKRARPVPVVLHHAVHGDAQRKLPHNLLRDFRVLHTAVNQQRIRPPGKSRVSRRKVPQPPREHLPHRRVVVLIRHIFQLEPLIVLF